jgi:hypothetical protein
MHSVRNRDASFLRYVFIMCLLCHRKQLPLLYNIKKVRARRRGQKRYQRIPVFLEILLIGHLIGGKNYQKKNYPQ